MNLLKTLGNTLWKFFLAMGEARAQRDLMQLEAMRKYRLGR